MFEQVALTDVLTSLLNRRHVMRWLGKVWAPAANTERPLSCMMIDTDGFKQINDQCGHDAGDEMLRRLARQLRQDVAHLQVTVEGGGQWLGSSIGVAQRDASITTVEDLLKRADEGLYQAKQQGRNCVAADNAANHT